MKTLQQIDKVKRNSLLTLSEINEKFDKNSKDWIFHHKNIPCIDDKDTKERIKQYYSSSLRDILEGIKPEEKQFVETASCVEEDDEYVSGWNDCREQIISNINKILE